MSYLILEKHNVLYVSLTLLRSWPFPKAGFSGLPQSSAAAQPDQASLAEAADFGAHTGHAMRLAVSELLAGFGKMRGLRRTLAHIVSVYGIRNLVFSNCCAEVDLGKRQRGSRRAGAPAVVGIDRRTGPTTICPATLNTLIELACYAA